MSGLEATRVIREKEGFAGKHSPIIATTAFAMSSDKTTVIDAGMDDYISRPIDIEKLKNIVYKWVGRIE